MHKEENKKILSKFPVKKHEYKKTLLGILAKKKKQKNPNQLHKINTW